MSKYFKNFKTDRYRFGDEKYGVLFQRLSTYIDVLDRVQDNLSVYTNTTVLSNERPDTLSYRIYGTTDHYWTFYLMNEKLREQGWPLTDKRIYEKSEEIYDGYFGKLEFADLSAYSTLMQQISSLYPVGESVNLVTSGALKRAATVKSKNLQNAEIYFTSSAILSSDTIVSVEYADTTNSYNFSAFDFEFNGTHHYAKTGSAVEYDLVDDPTDPGTPVTFQENFVAVNEDVREIRIIKPDEIERVVGEFKRLVS